ncbi:MAG: hypothetical protein ACP6KW_00805 [Candidatus Thorarchaeota archaeon]
MPQPLLPEELAGHFFGVGSVGDHDYSVPKGYVKDLKVPYAYQVPSFREEDMIRQFGSLIEGFEKDDDFVLDIDYYTYREMTEEEDPILIDEGHMHSLYALMDGTKYPFFKTQQTAPATMGFSIRDGNGKQHLNERLFYFYSRLMTRVAQGQVNMLRTSCATIILCQDDPGLGHVKSMIEDGKVVDLSLRQIVSRTDEIYPDGVIPSYHFCDDWRTLESKGWYPLWESRPKIVHIDLVKYAPEIDGEQAEKINRFLKAGGGLALGVLPNTDDAYETPVLETLQSNLASRLELMYKSGVDMERVGKQAMISTQCGLSGASPNLTREIHEASANFSEAFQLALAQLIR